MSYIGRDTRTDILINMLHKLNKLTSDGKISADHAFVVAVETAKDHPDWPEEEIATPAIAAPIPVPEVL